MSHWIELKDRDFLLDGCDRRMSLWVLYVLLDACDDPPRLDFFTTFNLCRWFYKYYCLNYKHRSTVVVLTWRTLVHFLQQK